MCWLVKLHTANIVLFVVEQFSDILCHFPKWWWQIDQKQGDNMLFEKDQKLTFQGKQGSLNRELATPLVWTLFHCRLYYQRFLTEEKNRIHSLLDTESQNFLKNIIIKTSE